MGKTFRQIVLLALMITLSACDSGNIDRTDTQQSSPAPLHIDAADTTGSAPEPEIPALPLDAHMARSYQDDLSGLLEKKYIRVLTTLNRTNFFISEGHLVGYEYSLLKDYEKYLNKRIQNTDLKIVLEFIPVARHELVPKLVQGYGDIAAAGLTITESRASIADFTIPYLNNIKEVVVSTKGKVHLKTLYDLSYKSVYVRKSSSYYNSLIKLNRKFARENKNPVHIVAMDEELETESILEMVNSGAIDITVADSHIANVWLKVLKNLNVHDDMVLREGARIAWMVRQNNPELKSSLNTFLSTRKQGTLFGNIYFSRYFEQTRKLKILLNWKNGKRLKNISWLCKNTAGNTILTGCSSWPRHSRSRA